MAFCPKTAMQGIAKRADSKSTVFPIRMFKVILLFIFDDAIFHARGQLSLCENSKSGTPAAKASSIMLVLRRD
jgi:hypothetical protein